MLARAVSIAFLGLAAFCAPAGAQDGAPPPVGTIEAIAYAPIPDGAVFTLQANDNTALTDDTMRRVSEAVTRAGYRLEPKAELVMSVETQLVRGVRQDTPVGELTATNNEAIVQGKLYSSTQNSLLNPQRPVNSAAGIFRIRVSVYNRTTGLYVWRGSINRSDPSMDINLASDDMVPALIGYLGKTEKPAAP
jgi:hypothetical protein